MGNWEHEFMPEYYRQRVMEEIEQIRLERLALKSRRKDLPHLFKRIIIRFASWMISTGKQMRKRYEAPAINCSNSPTGSFAD